MMETDWFELTIVQVQWKVYDGDILRHRRVIGKTGAACGETCLSWCTQTEVKLLVQCSVFKTGMTKLFNLKNDKTCHWFLCPFLHYCPLATVFVKVINSE